jgi:hypothetical protein
LVVGISLIVIGALEVIAAFGIRKTSKILGAGTNPAPEVAAPGTPVEPTASTESVRGDSAS